MRYRICVDDEGFATFCYTVMLADYERFQKLLENLPLDKAESMIDHLKRTKDPWSALYHHDLAHLYKPLDEKEYLNPREALWWILYDVCNRRSSDIKWSKVLEEHNAKYSRSEADRERKAKERVLGKKWKDSEEAFAMRKEKEEGKRA